MSKFEEKKRTLQVDLLTDKWQLSPAGAALLDVMLDPAYRFKNISEKCDIAGISRDSYYRLQAQEGFKNALVDGSKAILVSYAPGCAHSMGEAGLRGDFQSAKEILKQSGVADDVIDLNVHQDNKPSLKDILKRKAQK